MRLLLTQPQKRYPRKVNSSLPVTYNFSAATGYIAPILGKRNFVLQTEALVTKILFQSKVAKGVEYINSEGRKITVYANSEVILAAGMKFQGIFLIF
jgi:choline dehydrogenase-like flavoprotein